MKRIILAGVACLGMAVPAMAGNILPQTNNLTVNMLQDTPQHVMGYVPNYSEVSTCGADSAGGPWECLTVHTTSAPMAR
jgi:hypothetical protein